MAIQAVITFYDRGGRGVGGQIVGANGEGDYAVIFEADTVEEVEDEVNNYIAKLKQWGYTRISELKVIMNREGFLGSPIEVKKI